MNKHSTPTDVRHFSWSRSVAMFAALGLLLVSACGPPESRTCSSVGDCLADEECKDGTCQAKTNPPGCKADADCKAEEACDTASGACKPKPTPGCKADSDCKADETCETASGKCNPKAPGTCKADTDCKADETCENGACKPKSTGCQSDADCKAEEACDTASGACKPKPKPECTADKDCKTEEICKGGKCEIRPVGCASCQADEYCFNNERCLKKTKDCRSDADCLNSEQCVMSGTRNICLTRCDFSKNAGPNDYKNSDCWNGWGWCLDTVGPIGACIPPQSKIRKKGEDCTILSAPDKPEYHLCEEDLFCASTHKCVGLCDSSKGPFGHDACDANQYCTGSGSSGLCTDLPARKQGSKQLGETCSTNTSSLFCDGSKDLICNASRSVCVPACDPTKGKDNNPKCDSNYECVEYPPYSHLGGFCVIKPTQKVDEECDSLTNRCLDGLNCIIFGSKSACQQNCDPQKTGECPAGLKCRLLSGSTTRGFCHLEQKTIRKLHEQCNGLPGTPAYDQCEAQYACAGINGFDAYCLARCDLNSPQCESGFTCVRFTSGGVCVQNCTSASDCTKYGTACHTTRTCK